MRPPSKVFPAQSLGLAKFPTLVASRCIAWSPLQNLRIRAWPTPFRTLWPILSKENHLMASTWQTEQRAEEPHQQSGQKSHTFLKITAKKNQLIVDENMSKQGSLNMMNCDIYYSCGSLQLCACRACCCCGWCWWYCCIILWRNMWIGNEPISQQTQEHQQPRIIEKTQRFATSLTFFAHVELLATDSARLLIFLRLTLHTCWSSCYWHDCCATLLCNSTYCRKLDFYAWHGRGALTVCVTKGDECMMLSDATQNRIHSFVVRKDIQRSKKWWRMQEKVILSFVVRKDIAAGNNSAAFGRNSFPILRSENTWKFRKILSAKQLESWLQNIIDSFRIRKKWRVQRNVIPSFVCSEFAV